MVKSAERFQPWITETAKNVKNACSSSCDTLARLEREPDPHFDGADHEESKRILTTRIALLVRIGLLEADAAVAPPHEQAFRVQVHIRGVELLSHK